LCLAVIDALLTASLILDESNEMTSGDKKVFLLTGAYAESNRLNDLELLAEVFSSNQVGFNLLGANFWESEDEPDKRAAVPAAKKKNESALRRLVHAVGGRYHSLPEGCKLLSAFRSKTVAQRPTYTGDLKLGDMSVPVRMFLHAKQNPLPSFKKLSAYSQMLQQQDAVEGGGDVRAVEPSANRTGGKTKRERGSDDEDEIREEDEMVAQATMGVKMERDYVGVIEPDKHYPRQELVRGYRFGRTLVPFSADDLARLKYKVKKKVCVSLFFFFF
jgi:ATP-dependent DNA helicase 2 subunit 2